MGVRVSSRDCLHRPMVTIIITNTFWRVIPTSVIPTLFLPIL
jgi:hypothetical protein